MNNQLKKYLLKNGILLIFVGLAGMISPVAAQENSSKAVSIAAAERGNPYINFTDGKVLSSETGNLSAKGADTPLALASGDFDADGVPDLAAAYKTASGGLVSLQRGNVESIFPPNADAQPAPFFSEMQTFDLPFAPDFLVAGDFNADGRADLLAAKRGFDSLSLLAGNGDGTFSAPQTVKLKGELTAFAVGEVNNFDNLPDVAVGILEKGAAKILIFQNRNGAFNGNPEIVKVSKSVSALAFGALDAKTPRDLVAAAGNEIVIVSGQVKTDAEEKSSEIEKSRITRRKFDFRIKNLAIGDFSGENENEIAVLSKDGALKIFSSDFKKSVSTIQMPLQSETQNIFQTAKVSTRKKMDLIVGSNYQLNLVTNDDADNLSLAASFDANDAPVAVLPMRLNKDALSDLVVLTENKLEPTILMTAPTEIITVNSNGGGGGGGMTLFNAVQAANNTPGLQEIQFNLSGGTQISMQVSLPNITEALTLNGLSQSNPNGEPLVSITALQNTDSSTLVISGGNSVVRGLVLNCNDIGFNPVRLNTIGNNFVESNFIGTNAGGTVSSGTEASGIIIGDSSANTVGGALPQARNIISGVSGENSHGVQINGTSGNNLIKGNYIGTNKTGLAALSNGGSGVLIETAASGNVVGGATDGERNIISANGFNIITTTVPGSGVKIKLPANTFSDIVVENNFIGTNKDGNAALGNLGGGVRVEYAASIAPTALAQVFDNVISGNTDDGVYAVNNAAALGLNAAPQIASSFLWVGSRSSGNVAAPQIGVIGLIISSRSQQTVSNTSPEVFPSGNRIGTNAAGTAALPNTGNGIRLKDFPSRIEGNTISGNGVSGIGITGEMPFGNLIADNFIGTNSSGTATIRNANRGLKIEMYCELTSETQTTKIYDNVISGNTGDGVFASVTANCIGNNASPDAGVIFLVDIARRPPTNLGGATNTSPTVSLGNRIGTNAAGTIALPNTGNGVNLQNATAKIEGNIISANSASGIKVKAPASTTLFNQIADNFIGTDSSGNVDLGNAADGITFEFGAVAANQAVSNIWDNVISGNNGDGVRAFSNASLSQNAVPQVPRSFLWVGSQSSGNISAPQVLNSFLWVGSQNSSNIAPGVFPTGNRIGTNADGTLALGNSGHGVSIRGVRTKTEGNTIAHNGGNGVNLASIADQTLRAGNQIFGNRIYSNSLLGIDLNGDGVTLNDANDADTGANNLQNFPLVNSVQASGANLNLSGNLNSTPNKPFTLHFYANDLCDASNYGEGKNYLGTVSVATNAQGNAVYNLAVAAPLSGNRFITATATDEEGSTSEFSQCRQFVSSATRRAPFDFDGDGKTDIAIFRPASAEWWINRSSTGQTFAAQFGAGADKLAPGDYTGDGKTDIAVFRPSTGSWLVLRSEDFSFYAFPFGASGDVPAPSDYDGDGKTDAAVFRPSTNTWFINKSSGGTTIQQFGQSGDVPVVADYDGDAQADIAIFRPSVGQWWIQRSSNNSVFASTFGSSSDKAVPGDYTGDGKTDIAIFRPSSGNWFVLRSEDFSFYSFPFGVSTDIPAPGDYDGDGKTDAAVFRPTGSTWFVQRSTAGTLIQQFGAAGDKPVPNAFVP
ncbi:hypothetical protein BH10ACI1_BH10ACI1_03170 [soil metagenome]